MQDVLADDGADGRVAVLGGDVHEPALHGVEPILRDAQRHAGVVHAKEERAAVRVGERHHLARHGLGVRRLHATGASAATP